MIKINVCQYVNFFISVFAGFGTYAALYWRYLAEFWLFIAGGQLDIIELAGIVARGKRLFICK